MSAFLGPIHYWLYNKIILFEELESYLLDTYTKKYGNIIEKMFIKHCDKYDYPIITDEPLEKIIDLDNIHGWLQKKISIAEIRQAAFLNEIFITYGDEAIGIALDVYSSQGKDIGKKIHDNENPSSPQELLKAMNNYILDGMPCDHVNKIITSEEGYLEWNTVSCLHIGYWQSVGADDKIFYELRKHWIAAFVENANPEYKYEFIKTQDSLSHKIILGGK
ncbi:MAG: hypothetical protein GX308_00425 [Epulopiscium sp.]|nr:hypothetical protein [Candidatus Epulonipiscium sp.]